MDVIELNVNLKDFLRSTDSRLDQMFCRALLNWSLKPGAAVWTNLPAKCLADVASCLARDVLEGKLIIAFIKGKTRAERATENSPDFFTILFGEKKEDGYTKVICLNRPKDSEDSLMISGLSLLNLYFNNIYLMDNQDEYREYVARRDYISASPAP